MLRQLGQRAGPQRGADVGGPLVQDGLGHAVQQHEPEHDAGAHAGPDGQHRVLGFGRVAGHHGARPGDGQVQLEVRAERYLDDAVHLPDRGGDQPSRIGVGVVHDVAGAGLPGQLGLDRGADGRGHAGCPAPRGELDGEMPDRPGPAGHQDRGVLDRPVREHQVVRGQGGHAEAGPEFPGDAVRERHGAVLRDHRPFGGRPPAAPGGGEVQPYPLADPVLGPARADRVDHPGAILMGDLESVDGPRGHPGAVLDVGGIDSRDVHPDPDLTRARFRPVDIHHPQYLSCRAGAVIDNRFHRVSLTLATSTLAPGHPAITDTTLIARPARGVAGDPPRRARAGTRLRPRPRGWLGTVRPAGCRPALPCTAGQALRTASISSWTPILSLTTTPPVSIGALKFTPKSRRLISVVAVKPARVPP